MGLPVPYCGIPRRDNVALISAMIDDLETYVNVYRSQLHEKQTACESAKADVEEHQCIERQAEFEEAYCQSHAACAVLGECFDREKLSLQQIVESETQSMLLR